MDIAPDQGNPPETLTAIEKKIVNDFVWAIVFGVACCLFFLLALSAWNAIFMANAVGWWAATSAATGVAALNQYVKIAQGVKRAALLLWTEHKKTRKGHSHAI